MKLICNRTGKFDFCVHCIHSVPHEEYTHKNLVNHRWTEEAIKNGMAPSAPCKDYTDCVDFNGKPHSCKCVEFRTDEDKLTQIRSLLKVDRKLAIKIVDNFEKIQQVVEDYDLR